VLTAQTAQTDQHVQSILSKAAPTADQVNDVFNVRPRVAAADVCEPGSRRRHAQAIQQRSYEQLLVFLPEVGSVAQTLIASAPGSVLMNLNRR